MNRKEIQKQLADCIIGHDALTAESSNKCAAEAIKFLQSRFYLIPKGEVEVVEDKWIELTSGEVTSLPIRAIFNDAGVLVREKLISANAFYKPAINKSIILEE